MGSNEWKYLLGKVSFYAEKRGQARPVYLAEEFTDQEEMNKVVDILTEGYVHDMTGREGVTKNTSHVVDGHLHRVRLVIDAIAHGRHVAA